MLEIAILPVVLLIVGLVWTNDLENRLAANQEVLENVRWLRSLSGDLTHERLFQGMNLSGAQAGGLHLGCIDDDGKKTEKACPDLTNADASGAEFFHASLSGATLSNTVLDGASLGVADFSGANIWNSTFTKVWAQQAVWSDASLDGDDFTGANLACSTVDGATFVDVDFTDADLQCIDFTTASFDNVTLTGICYNEDTRFPEGVTPPTKSDPRHCRKQV